MMEIKKAAAEISDQLIFIRRHFHRFPELSGEEKATSDFISETLASFKIPHRRNVGGHGIVADLIGQPGGKTIALRADMDALPILEKNNCDYKSEHEGVMHACGHDVHMTCLLGVAKLFGERVDLRKWKGHLRLIFQPSEEKNPGGASLMIADGCLENPVPDGIIALHVFPEMEVGKTGFREGMYMASADEIYITVKGKGGHAALPDRYVNPLPAAGAILVALDQLGKKPAPAPTVLAFGKISSAGATNVIPDEVRIEGTFRTMDEKWRAEMHQLVKSTAEKTAAEFGCTVEINIPKGYPFLTNEPELTRYCKKTAASFLGNENVEELPIRMTAEDFSFYSQKIPACFFRLGTGNSSRGITSPVHTATFDIDEKALPIGTGLMIWLALNYK